MQIRVDDLGGPEIRELRRPYERFGGPARGEVWGGDAHLGDQEAQSRAAGLSRRGDPPVHDARIAVAAMTSRMELKPPDACSRRDSLDDPVPFPDATDMTPARGSGGPALSAVGAVLLGFVVLLLGGGVSGALMIANLQLAPTFPLFLPATVLWLWLFWRYVGGEGWPRSTSARRRDGLLGRMPSPRVWVWALVAGGLAVAAVMGIAFVTYRYAALPDAAHRAPFEVASLPPWTLVSVFAALALTAAVVEEAAFRGYMLSGLRHRLGWAVGIALVTLLFYLAHLSHAYATLAFVPFFLAHGLIFGLLVYYTRSIVPGVVLHAVSDFLVLPMQYGVIASAGEWDFVGQGWLTFLAGAAAIPAFRQLAKAAAQERILAEQREAP